MIDNQIVTSIVIIVGAIAVIYFLYRNIIEPFKFFTGRSSLDTRSSRWKGSNRYYAPYRWWSYPNYYPVSKMIMIDARARRQECNQTCLDKHSDKTQIKFCMKNCV